MGVSVGRGEMGRRSAGWDGSGRADGAALPAAGRGGLRCACITQEWRSSPRQLQ